MILFITKRRSRNPTRRRLLPQLTRILATILTRDEETSAGFRRPREAEPLQSSRFGTHLIRNDCAPQSFRAVMIAARNHRESH